MHPHGTTCDVEIQQYGLDLLKVCEAAGMPPIQHYHPDVFGMLKYGRWSLTVFWSTRSSIPTMDR